MEAEVVVLDVLVVEEGLAHLQHCAGERDWPGSIYVDATPRLFKAGLLRVGVTALCRLISSRLFSPRHSLTDNFLLRGCKH